MTCGLEVRCSIQLSYGRLMFPCGFIHLCTPYRTPIVSKTPENKQNAHIGKVCSEEA